MENLVYLVGAVVVSVMISIVIVLRNRKPTSMEAGIDAFNRELKALAPEKRPEGSAREREVRDRRPEHRTG